MNRTMIGLLTILLVITACSPAATVPAATATPTVAKPVVSPTPTAALVPLTMPPLDPTRLFGNPSSPWDANRVNAAVKDFKAEMREVSGIRAQLGPQADEFFRQIDQAETAAVLDLRRQLGLDVTPKVMRAPLRPHTDSALGTSQVVGSIFAFATLFQAPDLVQRPTDNRGVQDQPLTVKENDLPLNENVRVHTKAQTRVTGCRAEMEVDITIHAAKDGNVYDETAHGKIGLTICPDKNGKVPVDISLQTTASISPGNSQIQTSFTGHAVGLVDDEANLIGLEQDAQTETSVDKYVDAPGGTIHSILQGRMQYTLNGLNTKDWSFTNERAEWRGIVNSPQQIVPFAQMAHGLLLFGETMALNEAERKWKDSYCVAIKVDIKVNNNDEDVIPSSETPLTARLQHQFEGTELNYPIVATLTSGAVSVTPSGVKVPPPATFRYKAPDGANEEATVELVSRSRRGIGKRVVAFKTRQESYEVDAPWEENDFIRLQGVICSFTKPFTLKLTGHKPGGNQPYTGKVEFTPTDATSGKWLWTGSYGTPYLPDTYDRGGSTYQVVGLSDEGEPMIILNEFDHMGSMPGYFSKTWHIPGYQIELSRTPGACGSVESTE